MTGWKWSKVGGDEGRGEEGVSQRGRRGFVRVGIERGRLRDCEGMDVRWLWMDSV